MVSTRRNSSQRSNGRRGNDGRDNGRGGNGGRNNGRGSNDHGLNVLHVYDGTQPDAPILPDGNGGFQINDHTGVGRVLQVVSREESVLRLFHGRLITLREWPRDRIAPLRQIWGDEVPLEALVPFVRAFEAYAETFVARWGGAAVPDDIREALVSAERNILQAPEAQVFQFDDSVRGGLESITRVDVPNDIDMIRFIGHFGAGGPGAGGPGAGGPGAV